MTDLNGKDYRARVRLSNAANETLAEVGETCEQVPQASLAPLLASRKIEPVSEPHETAWIDLGRPDEPVVDADRQKD